MSFEATQCAAEALVADAQCLPQVCAVHGLATQGLQYAQVEALVGGLLGLLELSDDLQPGWVLLELQADELGAGVGAVLDVQLQALLPLDHVQARIEPGVQVAGPSQGLPGLAGAGLADVVHQADGDLVVSLDLAQEAQQLADLARAVLI